MSRFKVLGSAYAAPVLRPCVAQDMATFQALEEEYIALSAEEDTHNKRIDELRTEITAELRKMDVVHVRMRAVRKRMEKVLKGTAAATASQDGDSIVSDAESASVASQQGQAIAAGVAEVVVRGGGRGRGGVPRRAHEDVVPAGECKACYWIARGRTNHGCRHAPDCTSRKRKRGGGRQAAAS